jgi:F-type H+-transporting ATPase subunit gamma
VLAITSDRGLCGAFNSNVVRRALRQRFDVKDSAKEVRVSVVGKKAAEGMKRERVALRKNYEGTLDPLSYEKAQAIALDLTEAYKKGELDALYIVYNAFVNAATQKITVDQALPIQPAELPAGETLVDYTYEPGQEALLEQLLPRQLATRIYRALLESQAAEHAARMSAMENASKNAKEMVEALTLYYNRARQAAIKGLAPFRASLPMISDHCGAAPRTRVRYTVGWHPPSFAPTSP